MVAVSLGILACAGPKAEDRGDPGQGTDPEIRPAASVPATPEDGSGRAAPSGAGPETPHRDAADIRSPTGAEPDTLPDRLQVLRAIEEAETALARDTTPQALMRLGELKSRYEPWLHAGHPESDLDYARARQDEYLPDDPAGRWVYSGLHFELLVERFPDSELAAEAGWKLANRTRRGECEGWVDCRIEREFAPMRDFLRDFAGSEYAREAVDRINGAFETGLSAVPDLAARSPSYEPDRVRGLLEDYEVLIESLPSALRPEAKRTTAELWLGFHEYDRAREAYRAVLELETDPRRVEEARERLDAIPDRTFRQDEAEPIDMHRIRVRWDEPTGIDVREYVVRRATEPDDGGSVIARVPAGAERTYLDTTGEPGTEYWYRIQAIGDRDVESTPAYARTASEQVRVQLAFFDGASRRYCLLGRLETDFPQALCVDDDGPPARVDAALFGDRLRASGHRDAYVDELWFVDPSGGRHRRFRTSDPDFPAAVTGSIERGAEHLSVDADTIRGRVLVSVDEETGALWLAAPPGGGGALDCGGVPRRCWVSTGSRIWRYSAAGDSLGAISVDPGPEEVPEAFTTIAADPRGSSAWAYSSRSGRLLQVDSSLAIRSEIELEAYSDPLLDLERGTVWQVTGYGPSAQLIKRSLTGEELLTVGEDTVPGLSRSGLALDPATGAVWMYSRGRATRISTEGEVTVAVDLPVR